MITLYRPRACELSDSIQERLEDLVVAHRVQIVDGEALGSVPGDLPRLEDGTESFTGQEPIQACLARIEKRIELWSRYQGDACYIGDDSELC